MKTDLYGRGRLFLRVTRESTTTLFLVLLSLPAVVQANYFTYTTNSDGLTITGPSNLVIVVEACTNLANTAWYPVGTNTLTGGSSHFGDADWTNYWARFYRLRPL